MEKYSNPLKACPECRTSRARVRALLKRGARGDTEAYLGLAGLYFDLVSEHLYLCNVDRAEALQQTESILLDGWRQLPFLKRLSDWERFLARNLIAIRVNRISEHGPRPQELVELEADAKFALIAFDLESWSYPWLSLALRVQPQDLRKILLEARCKLLNINFSATSGSIQRCLSLVSADLDGQLKSSQKRLLLEKLCSCEETKSFKSRWLDYRCRLIELRQQIRLQTEDRDRFLHDLSEALIADEMLRPSITARVRNLFSFRDLTPEVTSAPRDFRYGR